MELAAKDGMNVINMSLGSDFEAWPNYPDAVAADNLVAAGIQVVAAQGNSGANGLFSGGYSSEWESRDRRRLRGQLQGASGGLPCGRRACRLRSGLGWWGHSTVR